MRIEISRQAEKDLAKIEMPIRKRIIKELLDLENSLAGKDIKKLKGEIDRWRLRVGDYHIIMTIDQDKVIILVLHIGHRREIYR
ncbi:type II toxin-antitoxin system RelE family toxin [Sporomusa termitida]|uniref:ParE toxin of type II toxin-antitoxin system, parDE n=1 Tax=Sporomusa termitida TaxID=2377 RepID=A0A517DXC7_9FIRM|nr:type II toxin-antitoxin system RelE/ParE family toxin [Sporomusa termitida]QDR82002.1 ParE toxin of type II toxin-antitoxin system, parDE [Sporomusa termitida]